METKIEDILTRGVHNVIPGKEELKKLLTSGDKLNIYLGIDPTATRIHLGHAVPLRKLQALAELGHHVYFLIGDFTALIGDTSDKDTERPVLTYTQIQENFQTYKKQAEKLVNFDKIKVVHNSDWLKPLRFEDIVKLCQHFSVGDFVGRELIRNRLTAGQRVGLHETLYPVMQGYDSFHLDTDIQIGGPDQTFNMQAGRTLLKDLAGKESIVLVTGYLEGTDGRKMSKSWGNAIWLTDEPAEMYGKVMSLRDELIVQYFTLATSLSLEEVEKKEKRLKDGENPMDLKKELAYEIVTELHSEEDAKEAEKQFQETFQKGEIPTEIQTVTTSVNHGELIDILMETNTVESRSQAKRLIQDKAVDVNGVTTTEIHQQVEIGDGIILKIGKKQFVKVVSK